MVIMDLSFYSVVAFLFYVAGAVLAVFALWRSRTPQGAAAWVIWLISFPFIAIPFFIVFGRNKFYKYVGKRKRLDRHAEEAVASIEDLYKKQVKLDGPYTNFEAIMTKMNHFGFLPSNEVDLLIDGEEAYGAIFKAIAEAKEYILFQFYIFQEDDTGRRFKDALIARAKEGVRVYFMYDYIGSPRLSRNFLKEMADAGVKTSIFKSTKYWKSNFQINFRNHRKLVIVDGELAFTGGFNIGNEYLGKSFLGQWRDTHISIKGPAAAASQISFVKDWYWVNEKLPNVKWDAQHLDDKGVPACVIHTGPADEIEACELTHVSLVESSKKKLYISTPYFVPSETFMNALTLAALRGVDIKIVLPFENDNILVKAAEKLYIAKLLPLGVHFYKYKEGFNHQKVMLIDDHTTMIGSVNLDSRSFFINFEITAIVSDSVLAEKTEKMFIKDISKSFSYTSTDMAKRNLAEKIFSRAANLVSPML